MGTTATLRHLRMSPRKMRPVCDVIRGSTVNRAIDILAQSRRRAAKPLLKLLRSAVAGAEKRGGVNLDRLYVHELRCDQGTVMKRWLPRARGSASPILKRSCHLRVVLEEK